MHEKSFFSPSIGIVFLKLLMAVGEIKIRYARSRVNAPVSLSSRASAPTTPPNQRQLKKVDGDFDHDGKKVLRPLLPSPFVELCLDLFIEVY